MFRDLNRWTRKKRFVLSFATGLETPNAGLSEPALTNAPVVDETVLAILGWTQTI